MSTPMHDLEQASRTQRIAQAVALAKAGVPRKQIAQVLGVSLRTAMYYLREGFEGIESNLERLRQIGRMDDIVKAHYPKIGEARSAFIIIKATELQAKLAGTLSPTQIEVHEERKYVAEWGSGPGIPHFAQPSVPDRVLIDVTPSSKESPPNSNGSDPDPGGNGHADPDR